MERCGEGFSCARQGARQPCGTTSALEPQLPRLWDALACPRPILVSQPKEVNDDRIDKLIRRVQKEKDKELRTKACGSEAQPESASFA